MKRVLKWPVHVNDTKQTIGAGPVVLVDTQLGVSTPVYVWTEETADPPPTRQAQVFGTGHQVPDEMFHLGSTVIGVLVWHVYADKETAHATD